MARHILRGRVHLAAIVLAANTGGAGSPVGDTFTTMMWIDGGSPHRLGDAFVGAAVAFPRTARGLGFVSAVFDSIPLTALALRQGGYDWGILAYAMGPSHGRASTPALQPIRTSSSLRPTAARMSR